MTDAWKSVRRLGLYLVTAVWYLFVVWLVVKPFSAGATLELGFALAIIGLATLHVAAFTWHECMPGPATRRISRLVSLLIASGSIWGLSYGFGYQSWGEHFGWGSSALVAILGAMSLHPRNEYETC